MNLSPSPAPHPRPVLAASGTAIAAPARGRLLLVDSDPLIRQAIEQIFGLDFAVFAFGSATDALDSLGPESFDIVLADQHLTGMSGGELVQRLHAIQPDVQAILLRTGVNSDALAEANLGELFAVVRKPFDVSGLRELVFQAHAQAINRRADRAYRTRLEQQAHLAESFRLERDIYAGALHDLNGSLTVIHSVAEALALDLSQAAPTPARAGTGQLQELLNDLHHQSSMAIEIARRSMRLLRHNHDQERCDAKSLLEDLGYLLRSHRSARGHQLRVNPPLAPLLLHASAADVFRMVTNLGLNALQATNRPHRVDIECWTVRDALPTAPPSTLGSLTFWIRDNFQNQPPFVAIAIRDDGPGVPASLVPRLFRESLTTKPDGEGTGLGLTVVYRALLENKVALHFTTVPGRGTCITLYLPA